RGGDVGAPTLRGSILEDDPLVVGEGKKRVAGARCEILPDHQAAGGPRAYALVRREAQRVDGDLEVAGHRHVREVELIGSVGGRVGVADAKAAAVDLDEP